MSEEIKGMILAAGLGTRLKPWTDRHPKALAIVNGKSLLQRNVEYLRQYGIKKVIVNVHHFADQIIQEIEKNNGWGSEISISDETDAVLETGGGLKKAAWFLQGSDFVLMNADVLTDMDLGSMIAMHQARSPLATLATRERKTSRYFLFDEQSTLCGWRNVETGQEKISKPGSNFVQLAFSGIHVIDGRIFSLIDKEGKFSMVDLYLELAADETIISFTDNNSTFIDVGKPESLAMASEMFPGTL